MISRVVNKLLLLLLLFAVSMLSCVVKEAGSSDRKSRKVNKNVVAVLI